MKKTCIECKGKGYHVLSYKICEKCHGTGVKSELNLKNHVKNISNQALKHFELDEEHEVPCFSGLGAPARSGMVRGQVRLAHGTAGAGMAVHTRG